VIGVAARPDQQRVVEEFFELFKTPWEIYRPGRSYDVVIATVDTQADPIARLIIVSGSDARSVDQLHRLEGSVTRDGTSVEHDGFVVPIYGDARTFRDTGTPIAPFVAAAGSAGRGVRVGYDLFDQISRLLTAGQPADHAASPALDLHIAMVRGWILAAGVRLVEIPPSPAGHPFIVCLTHDIDFIGIRMHRFDHTMWGFLWRSTIGVVVDLLRGRTTIGRAVAAWRAALSLPFVYLGWARDFWEPFAWYQRVERGLPATYFLIPFKGRRGDRVPGAGASRRAAAYDVMDVRDTARALADEGCEIGVHGIDAWHSASLGRDEAARVAAATGEPPSGIRTHWLLADSASPAALEGAGYAYDSTVGFNETIGYRAGTTQVFRPLETRTLLELPLHIQDGALFYPSRLHLSEDEAAAWCDRLIEWARRSGGVLTVLWHDRSHAPERFWGDFYIRLIARLKAAGAWFATGRQAVAWFGRRRRVRFERIGLSKDLWRIHGTADAAAAPALIVRVHQSPTTSVDIAWNAASVIDVDARLDSVVAHVDDWSSMAIGTAS